MRIEKTSLLGSFKKRLKTKKKTAMGVIEMATSCKAERKWSK